MSKIPSNLVPSTEKINSNGNSQKSISSVSPSPQSLPIRNFAFTPRVIPTQPEMENGAFYRIHTCQKRIVDKRDRSPYASSCESSDAKYSYEKSASGSASVDPHEVERLLVPIPQRILTSSGSDIYILGKVLKNTYLLTPRKVKDSSEETMSDASSKKIEYRFLNSPTNATVGDWSSSRSVTDRQQISLQPILTQRSQRYEIVEEISRISVKKMDKNVETSSRVQSIGVNTSDVETPKRETTTATKIIKRDDDKISVKSSSVRCDPDEILKRHPQIWVQVDKNRDLNLQATELTNITILVEGREFFTNKQILRQHSTWFSNAIDLMDEVSKPVIRLPNTSACTFDSIHKWMFLQHDFFTRENIIAVTKAAYQLKMPVLLENCLNYIERNKICIPKFTFTPLPYPDRASRMGSPRSKQANNKLVLDPRYFQKIIRCPEFFTIHVNTLETLISEDNLKINSEVEVFDATVSWLAYDWPNRVIHAERLLKHVRFACLTNKELISIIYHQKNLPVIALPFCRDLILRNYLYWSAYKSGYLKSLGVPLPVAIPRKCLRKKKERYALGRWEAAVRIQALWRGHMAREEMRLRHGAAAVIQAAFKSYLCRRWLKESAVQRMRVEECLIDETNRHRQSAVVIQSHFRKHVARHKFKSTKAAAIAIQAVVRGFLARKKTKRMLVDIECNNATTTLILLGGYDLSTKNCSNKAGRRCYLYRTHKFKWELVSVMPEVVHCGKAAIIENDIFIAGGCTLDVDTITPLNCVWKWNLSTGFWIRAANMRHCRIHHELVTTLGRLFAIGGKDENDKILASVEMYDPDCNEWYEVAPLLNKRMGHSASTFRDVIAVCGGVGPTSCNRGEILSTMEYYHPYDDKWCAGMTLRIPRCFSTLVEWRGELYLSGGVSCSTDIKGSISVIDKYDPEEEKWSLFIETNLPRHCGAAGVIDSSLCIVGGLSSQLGSALSSGLCYDLTTGKKVPEVDLSLPIKLTGMASVQIPLKLAYSIKAVC